MVQLLSLHHPRHFVILQYGVFHWKGGQYHRYGPYIGGEDIWQIAVLILHHTLDRYAEEASWGGGPSIPYTNPTSRYMNPLPGAGQMWRDIQPQSQRLTLVA